MTRRTLIGTFLALVSAPFMPKVKPGGQGYIYRSEDIACSVEEFSERCRPHLEAAQRQLAEAIDRG